MRRFKQTIYTCGRLLPSCLLRETTTTKKGFNDEDCAIWFCVTISITKTQTHFFFLCWCYPCHPCFLLYYSISERCCKFMCMVWTYVCKEEMWESVQEDALFLLWNILSLLIPKQELCLFLFLFLLVVCTERDGKDARTRAADREDEQETAAAAQPPCREGGCYSSSEMATQLGVFIRIHLL